MNESPTYTSSLRYELSASDRSQDASESALQETDTKELMKTRSDNVPPGVPYDTSPYTSNPRSESPAPDRSQDASKSSIQEAESEKLLPTGGERTSQDLPYDPGKRWLAVLCLVSSTLSGIAFLGAGIGLSIYSGSSANASLSSNFEDIETLRNAAQERVVFIPYDAVWMRAGKLGLSAIVTATTEATGYVHGATLKWTLAKHNGLQFNTNLRLIKTGGHPLSPNGWVTNAIFAISLILSYSAAATCLISDTLVEYTWISPEGLTPITHKVFAGVTWVPLVVMGVMFLLQSLLATIAYVTTDVPTWSSSPMDVTAALVHHGLIKRVPGRCMRSIEDEDDPRTTEPIRPSEHQVSAWASHRNIRRVVWVTWGLAGAGLVWGIIVLIVCVLTWGETPKPDAGNWIFQGWTIAWNAKDLESAVFLSILILGGIQGVLTMGLHSCELIVNTARDEAIWRRATKPGGTKKLGQGNALLTALLSWQSMGLFVAKTAVHWLFGNAIAFNPISGGNGPTMQVEWILITTAGVIVVGCFVTFVAKQRPVGPQPATYGHVQTLANLVDEWSVVMYWGHKSDGDPAHAGTSDKPLPAVFMKKEYAV